MIVHYPVSATRLNIYVPQLQWHKKWRGKLKTTALWWVHVWI